jgi:hypothetical protein
MSTDKNQEHYSSSQLSSFGDVVPVGTYTRVKLKTLDAKESENAEKPSNFVSLSFEILDKGEQEGLKAFLTLFPTVTKSPKNGKLYSKGLFEAQQMCAAWGVPLVEFSLDEYIKDEEHGRKGCTIKGARALVKMIGDSYKKAGAPLLRIKVQNEKAQEAVEQNGKKVWVDKKDEDGNQVYNRVTHVLGRAAEVQTNATVSVGKAASALEDSVDDDVPSALNFV